MLLQPPRRVWRASDIERRMSNRGSENVYGIQRWDGFRQNRHRVSESSSGQGLRGGLVEKEDCARGTVSFIVGGVNGDETDRANVTGV